MHTLLHFLTLKSLILMFYMCIAGDAIVFIVYSDVYLVNLEILRACMCFVVHLKSMHIVAFCMIL